jgi:hypothetical protein
MIVAFESEGTPGCPVLVGFSGGVLTNPVTGGVEASTAADVAGAEGWVSHGLVSTVVGGGAETDGGISVPVGV